MISQDKKILNLHDNSENHKNEKHTVHVPYGLRNTLRPLYCVILRKIIESLQICFVE